MVFLEFFALFVCQPRVHRNGNAHGAWSDVGVSERGDVHLHVGTLRLSKRAKRIPLTGINPARVLGPKHYGPVQVLAGQALGSAIFGGLALWAAWRLTRQLGRTA